MAQEHFTPLQQPLVDLLNKNLYIIPAYQRPYSWSSLGKSNKNDQVNQMWDDLLEAFTENPKEIYSSLSAFFTIIARLLYLPLEISI